MSSNPENHLYYCLPRNPLPVPISRVLPCVCAHIYVSGLWRTCGSLASLAVLTLPPRAGHKHGGSFPQQLHCLPLTPLPAWPSESGSPGASESLSGIHLPPPQGPRGTASCSCHLPGGMSKAPSGFASGPGLESIRHFLNSACSLLGFRLCSDSLSPNSFLERGREAFVYILATHLRSQGTAPPTSAWRPSRRPASSPGHASFPPQLPRSALPSPTCVNHLHQFPCTVTSWVPWCPPS